MKIPENRSIEMILAGRAGIDLNTTALGASFAEIGSFTKSVGGSPANIVQGAARLGLKTGFIGKIARDGMGEYILSTFESEDIDTKGIMLDATGARNCIALTEILSAENSGTYAAASAEAFHHGTYLYRGGTADLLICEDEISEEYVASAKSVMLSGVALSSEPSRGAMLKILEFAKKHGTLTVLDIDYRPYGWKSLEETAEVYQQVIDMCDVVIGNREELDAVEYTTMPDNKDSVKSAAALLAKGVKLAVIKDGANGSICFTPDADEIYCGVIPTKALKTFGSGDAFAAGLMYGILREKGVEYSVQLGTACASIALTGISCAPSMPTLEAAEAHRASFFDKKEG